MPPHSPQKGSGRTVYVCGHGPQHLREKVLQLPQDCSETMETANVYPTGLRVTMTVTVRIQMQTMVLVDFQVACWTHNQPNIRCYFSYAAAYIPGPGGSHPAQHHAGQVLSCHQQAEN